MEADLLRAAKLAGYIRQGRVSVEEVVRETRTAIEALDGEIHAFLHFDPERALDRARDLDRRIAGGEQMGPLAGLPVAIKDNICTRGVPTTAASRILEGYRPPYDATVVRRIEEAGGIVIGKTNLDEFGMGSSCENSAFGPTRNPWDTTRVPGGSSGGSAAAVAAGLVPLALGSDTGGSVRQPAALSGSVGVKPTYGRVSRHGLIALASSLDQIGPMARSVEDAALLLEAISGHDPRDSTSADEPVPTFPSSIEDGVSGTRIGLPDESMEGLEPGVEEAVRKAVERLEAAGAEVRPVSLECTPHAVAAYYLICTAEASSNLARYDGTHFGRRAEAAGDLDDLVRRTREEGLGPEVKRRILLGSFVLSAGYYEAYYLRAARARTRIQRDFERVLGDVDVIVGPTSPFVAFPLGERTADPLQMYLCDVLTTAVNLAGLPGVSVPCGLSEGLPVGLQVIGPAFEEARCLRVARAVEAESGFEPLNLGEQL